MEGYVTYLQGQLEGLVNWLGQVSALSKQHAIDTAKVEVAGLPYAIPTPIAELVKGVGVVIDAKFEDDDEDGK